MSIARFIIAISWYLHMENTYSQTCIVHYVTALYVRGKYRVADFQRILSSCRIRHLSLSFFNTRTTDS